MFGSTPWVFSALADLAEPLARLAGTRTDAQAEALGSRADQGPGPREVAEVVATAEVISLNAQPPLRRDDTARGFELVCVGATRLEIVTRSGRRSFDYRRGTVIAVEQGLLQLPPEHRGSRLRPPARSGRDDLE